MCTRVFNSVIQPSLVDAETPFSNLLQDILAVLHMSFSNQIPEFSVNFQPNTEIFCIFSQIPKFSVNFLCPSFPSKDREGKVVIETQENCETHLFVPFIIGYETKMYSNKF